MRSASSSSTESRAPSERRRLQLGRLEQPLQRVPERLRRAGRHEQPVDAVGDDLADAADGGRDQRRADGQRLDGGVREVLPVAGEDGRLGAGERVQHLLPRQRADEAHPAVQAGVVRVLLEAGAVGAVADDRQRGRRHVGERVEGDVHRLLPGQAAREDEPAALRRRRLARRPARGSARRAGARSRGPSRARSRRGSGSGRSASSRARSARVRARFSAASRAPPACWKSSSVPSKRPQRRARSYAGSETSFATSGRREPHARRRGGGVGGRRVDDVRRRARPRVARSVSSPYRTGNGRPRSTVVTGQGSSVGGADAIVTTCTEWPRPTRKRASSGPCVAGPPTSGGQIPGRTAMRIRRRIGRPVAARGPRSPA